MPINGVNSIGHVQKVPSPETGRYSKLMEGLAWTAGLAAALFTGKAVYTGVVDTNASNSVNARAEEARQDRLNVAPEKDEQLKNLIRSANQAIDAVTVSSDDAEDPYDAIREFATPGLTITPEIAQAVRTHFNAERGDILQEIQSKYYETLDDPNALRSNAMVIRLVMRGHVDYASSTVSNLKPSNDLQASLHEKVTE